MFKNLLNPENGLMITVSRITDAIFLSLFWIIGCIPVVTLGASTAALYDSSFLAAVLFRLSPELEGGNPSVPGVHRCVRSRSPGAHCGVERGCLRTDSLGGVLLRGGGGAGGAGGSQRVVSAAVPV